jgi:hypothetical protein
LTNNVLIARVKSTANRHQGPANVKALVVVASGNVIIGGNSGVNARDAGSVISKNVIVHDSFATNGYGIWLYAPDRVIAKDNIILPISGRGILLNGVNPGNDNTSRGHHNTFDGNIILAREKPNTEFGESLNANGIRIRHQSSDNVVTNNYVLAVGGGDYCGASGLYLSVAQADATSTITNNTFCTIVSGTPDVTHYAKGLALERNLALVNYRIDGNTIQSNHMLISTSGYDGSGQLGRPMVGNTLEFVDGKTAVMNFQAAVNSKLVEIGMANNPWAQAVVAQTFESLATTATTPIQPAHKTFYSGFYTGDEHVTLLDTKGNAGLDLSDVFVASPRYPGARWIGIGQYSRVQAVRQGKPLAERSASISTGGLTLEEWTDGQGFFDLPAVGHCLGRARSVGGEPYVRQDNQSIQVTLEGTTKDIDPSAVPKVLEF